jgi:hypothetical protein
MKRTCALLFAILISASCSSGGRTAVRTTEPVAQTSAPSTTAASSTTVATTTTKAAVVATTAPVPAPNGRPLAVIQAGNDVLGVQPGFEPLWRMRDAVVAIDGSAILTTKPDTTADQPRTIAEVFDTRSGAGLGRWTIDGAVTGSVVAPDGKHVALTADRGLNTRIVVINAETGVIRDFGATGHVRPEVFQRDGSYLFVLDDRPAAAPTYYRVQSIEVATGQRFDTNSRDKGEEREDMTGAPVRAISSADGVMLSTLYRNPGKNPTAFVHIINLEMGYTYCADLPAPFGTGAPGTDSIALSPDGKQVLVASAGSFATINLEQARQYDSTPVSMTTSLVPPPHADLLNPRGAVSTPDGIVEVIDGHVRLGGRATPVDATATLLAVV